MPAYPPARRTVLATAGVAMMLGLAACGSGSGGSSADNPLGLQQPGVLHVGTLTDAPPNVFLKDGQFTGFDNDLLKAVAAKAGLKVEFAGTDFSGLLAQVKSGKYDVGSSSITITEKRKQTVDFTHGYDFGYLGLDVPAGSAIKGFDQLTGKRVVVVQGTVQDDYATGKGLNPVRVPDYNSALNQLKAGTVDAWVSPAEIGEKLAGQSSGKVVLAAKELSPTPMAFAVAKDKTALKAKLDQSLDEVIKDGTWNRLVAQYYPGRKTPASFTPGSGAVQITR
ncbi:ABC transporter substrate-binding protein [Arsenicicoccus sp. oral taxon 190]|uniref:ABC transporter substrate-binding protein n=1 Tax=Arsenicicoccus sp. oral taxon 190 TaxID=1658671 RepID=UPI00067A28ED|nr:ABC transporter substrate-binding protein [Arsenicicoccus sp. oral taxon 190]AKT51513.1 ABC transporter substrate-binding protein [Arsenicicoccus sp. oral taxon 190]